MICTIKILRCTMARNQSICIGNTNVIEGPYQETMDDPMKFSHQPSNEKCNLRTKQWFLYQLKNANYKVYANRSFHSPLRLYIVFTMEREGRPFQWLTSLIIECIKDWKKLHLRTELNKSFFPKSCMVVSWTLNNGCTRGLDQLQHEYSQARAHLP